MTSRHKHATTYGGLRVKICDEVKAKLMRPMTNHHGV
jgi:hypothetical protein